jgi:hypothetical protein
MEVSAAAVNGRNVFYNNSSFDGADAAASEADDAAVAVDKQPWTAGQAGGAAFANVTSYVKGLNGIMIDLRGLPGGEALGVDDFSFRAGALADPSGWSGGPRPSSVSVRRGAGAGGSDRVTLVWPDYNPLADPATTAVGNGWLEVTVAANGHTGLAEPDVFAFGNLLGETGDGTGATGWRISALDASAVKRALNAPSPVTSTTDFNRDGRTNALDLSVVRRALNHALPAPAAAPPAAPAIRVRRVAEVLGLVG